MIDIQTIIRQHFIFAENEMIAQMHLALWGDDPKWAVEQSRMKAGWGGYTPYPKIQTLVLFYRKMMRLQRHFRYEFREFRDEVKYMEQIVKYIFFAILIVIGLVVLLRIINMI